MADDVDDRDDGEPRELSGNGAKPRQGYRKDGKPFKEGNTREDGSFAVGKNRTPEYSRFAVGDGRKRGERPKGVKNADTEFMEELNRKTVVNTKDGKSKLIPKRRIVDMVLIENATVRKQNKAIEMIYERRDRIAEKAEATKRYHTLDGAEVLKTYLRQRQDELNIDPNLFGDPEPNGDVEAADD